MLDRLAALFRRAPATPPRPATPPARPPAPPRDEGAIAAARAALEAGVDAATAQALLAQDLPVELRERALAAIDDSGTLRAIALGDRMARVRLAAAQRLTADADLEALRRDSSDKAVQRHARETLRARREQANRHEQAQARAAELLADLQAHARHALEPLYEARLTTLEKAWLALPPEATDATQQSAARDAIAAARQRLQAQRDELATRARDASAQEELAAACRELEQTLQRLAREDWSGNVAAVTALLTTQQTRWQEAARDTAPPAALAARMREAQGQLSGWLDAAAELPRLADEVSALLQAIDAAGDEPGEQFEAWDEQYQSLTAQLAWPEGHVRPALLDALATAGKRLDQWRRARRADVAATLRHLKGRRQALRRLVEEGQLRAALRLQHWLAARIAELPARERAAEQEALAPVQEALGRLQEWYAFASVPKKEELCARMEALADDAQPPAERSEAVRALREQWNALCAANPEADPELRTRFDAAAERAWAPCAVWHEQQHAQRIANLDARRALCDQLEALLAGAGGADTDWRAIEQQERSLRDRWRQHDPVPWPDARPVHDRFQALVQALREKLEAARARGLAAREALVTQAQQLLEKDDIAAALNEARALQDAWKAAPWAPHKPAQDIWARFRTALDAVYARRDAERDAEKHALEAARAAEQAQRAAEAARRRAQRQERMAARLAALELALEIDALEQRAGNDDANLATAALAALPASPLRDALAARLAALATPLPDEVRAAHTARRAAQLLDLEIALDIPSPPELAEARLQRRVGLLGASLRGTRPDADALDKQLDECLATGPVNDGDGAQSKRLAAVVAAVRASLQAE